MEKGSRYGVTRKILIFWCLFIGIGAVLGSMMMFIAPDGSILGMENMLPYFKVLPFSDILFTNFIFSGVSLLIVNGLTNITAAALLFKKRKSGIVCGMIFGITLMAWIIIQFVIFPSNFMSTIYFIFGALQAITGYVCLVSYKQNEFVIDTEKYKNIGNDKTRLVVYFSRTGYTKKVALEEADKTGADIYEIKSTEKVSGTSGFWWCGRYAMHKWYMPIETVNIDLEQYEKVTICAPIWCFNVSATVRNFCKQASGKIKRVDYIFTHFSNLHFNSAKKELNTLLNLKAESVRSTTIRQGKVKRTRGL